MNVVILKGNISQKAELKTVGDLKILEFSVALNKFSKEDDKKKTDFIKCVAFGKRAEVMDLFFMVGSQILLEGSLDQNVYKTKEGQSREVVKVVVSSFEFCGKKDKPEEAETDPIIWKV